MFTDDYPLLQKMTLLTGEKLCALRDYPRGLGALPYGDYGDGVLFGCSVVVLETCLLIEPGIVRYDGRQYMLNAALELPYSHSDEWRILKIRFFSPHVLGDFMRCESEILLDSNDVLKDEIELCRFKLKRGARLRQEYVDFTDMATEFDTLNLLYAPYAARGASTLHAELLRVFAREALRFHIVNPMDAAFLSACLGGGVAREYILFYVAQRLRLEFKDYPNAKLHALLCEILALIKREGPCARQRREADRRIIVE